MLAECMNQIPEGGFTAQTKANVIERVRKDFTWSEIAQETLDFIKHKPEA